MGDWVKHMQEVEAMWLVSTCNGFVGYGFVREMKLSELVSDSKR